MVINIILILVILIGTAVAGFRYAKSLNENDYSGFEDELDRDIDLQYLEDKWSEELAKMQRRRIDEDNLSKSELEARQKKLTYIREAVTLAGYGDVRSIRTLKNLIKDFLMDAEFNLTEKKLDSIIPYNKPEKLKENDMTKLLLYLYGRRDGDRALESIINEFHLDEKVFYKGEWRYIITIEKIKEIYKDVMSSKLSLGPIRFDFNDKIELLAQTIFERTTGYGVIDMLIHQNIDEIDIGNSGVPYNMRTLKGKRGAMAYSYESTWIMFHGKNIQLECLHFESQEELIRVCDNVYKYEAPGVLSRNEGSVLSTMIDGSRILVCRPPFADSYQFFLRKFDSAPAANPAALIRHRNNAIPIALIRWMILCQRTIGITGSMGTGKSTTLKSFLRFIDPALNKLILEKAFELNVRFTYPYMNIVTLQETVRRTMQMGQDLGKKMNRDVNIIGEIAEALQSVFLIKSNQVASLFSLFTHHANTTKDLVNALAEDLRSEGYMQSEISAIRKVASCVNIDCHLNKYKEGRHIEHITEIIPVLDDLVMPSQTEEMKDASITEKAMADMITFFNHQIHPELFKTKDLVRLVKAEDGVYEYRLLERPSSYMFEKIKAILTEEQEKEFYDDLGMMERLSNGDDSMEVKEWEKRILSY